MAILGYNTVASYVYPLTTGNNSIITNRYDNFAGSSGTATVIKCYVDPFSSVSDYILGLYEWNGSSWALLDQVTVAGVAAAGTPGLISGSISATITNGNSYKLACLAQFGSNILYDDTGSGPVSGSDIASYDDNLGSFTLPSTLGSTTDYTGVQSTLWVEYTVGGGGGTTVTPGTCDDTDQGIAPTVSITNNQFVAPGTCNDNDQGVAPTVNITNHQFVAPGTCNDTDQGVAPTVNITNHQFAAPSTCDDTDQGVAPTVTSGNNVSATPGTCNDTDQGVAPTVNITNHQFAAPGTCNDTDQGVAPTVNVSNNQDVTPGTCSDTDEGIMPTVSVSANIYVSPSTCNDTDQGIAPIIQISSYLLIGTLKKWNGSAWVPHAITRYRGVDISMHPLKAFDDTDNTWKKIKQL